MAESGADRVPWYRSPFVWAFVVGCATLTLIRPLLRHEPPPPPVTGELPPFRLVDDRGRPFGKDDLERGVWVVGFFCTRCPGSEALLQALGSLAERYDEAGVAEAGLLAISVDPEHDDPDRMRAWVEGRTPGTGRLRLLGGAPDRVAGLLRDGFRVPVVGAESGLRTDWGTRLALVDASGGVRGFYPTDPMGLDEIFHRSRHVLRASPPRGGGADGPGAEVW